jgi:hypothetical protein
MKKVGIFYGHLENITGIVYILRPFGNLMAVWYVTPRFGILYKEKSGNPIMPLTSFRTTRSFVVFAPGLPDGMYICIPKN